MNFGRFPRAAALTLGLGTAGIFLTGLTTIPVVAQQSGDVKLALSLEKQGKMDQAVQIWERLASENPKNGEILFRYGFALQVRSLGATGEELRQIRLKVRKLMIEAKNNGYQDALLENILDGIPEDGSGGEAAYSAIPDADKAMKAAEAAFSTGKFDTAIENYKKALKSDPTLYEAALFTGDSYFKKGFAMKSDGPERANAYQQAEEWYGRAVEINPNRETAYRYWATVLFETNRPEEAKAKVVEAFISEPYSRLSPEGLVRWAQTTRTKIGHPNLGQPKSDVQPGQGKDGKPQVNINLDPGMLGGKDGRSAWIGFDISRALYISEYFKKDHPQEKEYRHSLKEDVFAYQSVLRILREQLKKGDVKEADLNPGLRTLLELDKAGLLEAYILLARPDRGIARDFPDYLQTSRDKLRQYVLQFVIQK